MVQLFIRIQQQLSDEIEMSFFNDIDAMQG